MKFFKNLFSRFVFNALLVIGQAAVVALLIFRLSKYFFYIYVAANIFAYLIVLLLVNKKQSANLKLPWIIFILLFPIPGSISYVIFGRQYFPKKRSERYKMVESKTQPFLSVDENIELPEDVNSEFNYLKTVTNNVPTKYNDLKYYKSGEDLYADLLESIKKAEKYIFIEFFILSKGKMLNEMMGLLELKVQEGLDVRVIYDDIGSMKKLSVNFNRKMEKRGIKCLKFRPFIPIMSGVHNNRDHRKIIVIDGKICYTGGINLADEYINEIHPFGHWKDNGIKVEGSAVDYYLGLFLTTWNTNYRVKDLDYKDFFTPQKVSKENIMFTFGDGPAPIYNEHITNNVYLNIINNSKKYLYITTPYLIIDYDLTNALKIASKRGVDVRIITPHIPDKKAVFWITRNSYAELIKAGVKIYEYTPGFIHSKCILCDDYLSILGTVNFDYRSLIHHFECASIMYNVSIYQEMYDDFMETLEKSEEISLEKAKKLNRYNRLFVYLIELFAPLL